MKRYTLSKRDSSEILEQMSKGWPKDALPKSLKTLHIVELELGSGLLMDEDFAAVKVGDHVLPFLGKEDVLKSFPSVTVDMGAVKHVCNGARVMRPGIVEIGEFNAGDIVAVKDSRYGRYLAVGLAIKSGEGAKAMDRGPVVDNLHYVGDRFWNAYKEGLG